MRTGRFEVQIDDVEVPGWQTVNIPRSSTEQGEYREGNDAEYETQLSGVPTFDDLEMERGVRAELEDDFIWEWRRAVIEANTGEEDRQREGKADEGRKEIAVTMQDEAGRPLRQWRFSRAWIKEYSPPDLDASADGETATESLTVAFDKMIRKEA